MPTPVPSDRIPRLKAALERYGARQLESLPALAELYGVAPNRMGTLIKYRIKGFPKPTKVPGDRTLWFKARAAINEMIAYTQGKGKKNRESALRAAAVMSGKPMPKGDLTPPVETDASTVREWPTDVLTPTEINRLVSAEMQMFRLKKEQGEFVRRVEVEDMANRLFSLMSQRITNLPAVIDPNGLLPALERARLAAASREIAVALHSELQGFLTDAGGLDGEASQPSGRAQPGIARRRARRGEGGVSISA